MNRHIIAIVLVIASGPAVAGWSSFGNISAVMPYEDGNLHVWADMQRYDPNSCGNERYIMPASMSANIKETLSVALTSLTAKLKVRFLIDSSSCTGGNPTLKAIELRP